MKKVVKFFVLALCLVVLSGGIIVKNKMSVYAYTEEEKEQAKAWLSANGYPPTMAGAEQAYQDYLNGKFGPIGGEEPTPEPVKEEATVAETVVETVADPAAEQKSVQTEETKKVVTEAKEVLEEETTSEEVTTSTIEESTEEISETESVTQTESVSTEEEESSTEEEESSGKTNWIIVFVVILTVLICAGMIFGTIKVCNKKRKD